MLKCLVLMGLIRLYYIVVLLFPIISHVCGRFNVQTHLIVMDWIARHGKNSNSDETLKVDFKKIPHIVNITLFNSLHIIVVWISQAVKATTTSWPFFSHLSFVFFFQNEFQSLPSAAAWKAVRQPDRPFAPRRCILRSQPLCGNSWWNDGHMIRRILGLNPTQLRQC